MKNFLLSFSCFFGIYIEFWAFSKNKKKWTKLSISGIIGFEINVYLNA